MACKAKIGQWYVDSSPGFEKPPKFLVVKIGATILQVRDQFGERLITSRSMFESDMVECLPPRRKGQCPCAACRQKRGRRRR